MAQDKPSASTQATQPTFPQSSMQDIIASISRIIDQDKRTFDPPRSSAPDRTGILELTDAIDEVGAVRRLSGDQPFERQAAAGPVESTSAAAPAAQPAIGARTDEPRQDLVSPPAAESAVAAFGRLEAVAAEQSAALSPALAAGARSLEQIVCDALRPLLQTWLDEHLPGLVERLVQEEIQRLVRAARPR